MVLASINLALDSEYRGQYEGFSVLKEIIMSIANRTKGSHHFLKHDDGRCTVVPVHSGETIEKELLSHILRNFDITKNEFRDFL